MAAGDKKISELDSAAALTGAEIIPLVQSSVTFKTLLSTIYTYFQTTFITATLTLTNKRITKRVYTAVSDSTLTPDADSYDTFTETTIAALITISNPTGTPTNAQEIEFRLKDDGTPQTISWGADYVDLTGSLPTTTTAGKWIYAKAKYINAGGGKWHIINVQIQP